MFLNDLVYNATAERRKTKEETERERETEITLEEGRSTLANQQYQKQYQRY